MKLRPRARGISAILPLTMGGPRFSSLVFLLIALALFAASTVHPGSLRGLRTGATDLAAPVLATVNRPVQAAAAYVRMVSGLADLQAENARLAEENARLRQWYQTAHVLKAENEALQDLLHVSLSPQHSFVTARVISDSGNSYVRSQLVMAGKKNGVDKGQAVLTGDGVSGRIIEAGKGTARVLLLTDINSRVPVMIEGSAYYAILAGDNGERPVLDHLPPAAMLEEGARVVTSGHGGIFPYGLPVGRVVAAEKGWAVQLFADAERAAFVRIVDSNLDPNLRPGELQ